MGTELGADDMADDMAEESRNSPEWADNRKRLE